MCDVRIHENGDKVDVRNGGILIRGNLQIQPDKLLSGQKDPTKLSMIGFLTPQKADFEIWAEAESKDYTVLLHFSAALRDRVIAASGKVNTAMVTAQHKKNLGKGISNHDGEDAHRNASKATVKSVHDTNHLYETAGGINNGV